MFIRINEYLVYSDEFKARSAARDKSRKMYDGIIEVLNMSGNELHYTSNSPTGYEFMINVTKTVLQSSSSDTIFYCLISISSEYKLNYDISVDFHWGMNVDDYYRDLWIPTLKFFRHILSPEEDYGKFYSFITKVKVEEADKVISRFNKEDFFIYNSASKYNI